MEIPNYTCAKCGNTTCGVTELSMAGGWLSRLFNFQYRKFSAVSCTHCSYTELYRAESGKLANIFDILAGG
jgi:predicted nucleic-acid-binding Zn-ribbon protein